MVTTRVPVPIGTLAVTEHGVHAGPTIVLLHGYPDTSHLWEPVARALAVDHHVVTYDVRGAGASDAPRGREGYRMRHLLADLTAVLDAVAAGEQVHLAGHDWGAIQGFAALHAPEVAARLASFTALSAPGLEVLRSWVRARVTDRSLDSAAQLAGQLARSWYVLAFQLPVLPEQVVRRALLPLLRSGGHPAPSPTVVEDAVRGIELYRANLAAGGAGSRSDPVASRTLPEDVAVQVVLGRHDRYVSPRVFDDLRDRLGVPVHVVDGGHWLPLSHPDIVARHMRTLTATS